MTNISHISCSINDCVAMLTMLARLIFLSWDKKYIRKENIKTRTFERQFYAILLYRASVLPSSRQHAAELSALTRGARLDVDFGTLAISAQIGWPSIPHNDKSRNACSKIFKTHHIDEILEGHCLNSRLLRPAEKYVALVRRYFRSPLGTPQSGYKVLQRYLAKTLWIKL